MIKNFIISILAILWLYSCEQRSNSRTDKINIQSERAVLVKIDNEQQSLIQDLEKYVYTDTTYASSSGKGITIQNSFPKGGNIEIGKPYIDSTGKKYSVFIFWTRVINGTNTALEFKVNFPAESFSISSKLNSKVNFPAESFSIPSIPNPYVKLFLPTDTMTFDKLSSYSYGLTKIKPFLDTNFNKPTTLVKTINPEEEYIFYTVALAYQAGGPARAEIILKEHQLYYRIGMGPNTPLEVPSGKIVLKNE